MSTESYVGNWYGRTNSGTHQYYGAVAFIQLVKVLPTSSVNTLDEFVQVIEIRNYIQKYIDSSAGTITPTLLGDHGPDVSELDLTEHSEIRRTRLYEAYLKEMVFPYPISRELSLMLDLYCVGRGMI